MHLHPWGYVDEHPSALSNTPYSSETYLCSSASSSGARPDGLSTRAQACGRRRRPAPLALPGHVRSSRRHHCPLRRMMRRLWCGHGYMSKYVRGGLRLALTEQRVVARRRAIDHAVWPDNHMMRTLLGPGALHLRRVDARSASFARASCSCDAKRTSITDTRYALCDMSSRDTCAYMGAAYLP